MDRTHYDILGVEKTATKQEIKEAYRKQTPHHHPDTSKYPNSENIFRMIQEAYETLYDEQKRVEYDKTLNSNHRTENTSDAVVDVIDMPREQLHQLIQRSIDLLEPAENTIEDIISIRQDLYRLRGLSKLTIVPVVLLVLFALFVGFVYWIGQDLWQDLTPEEQFEYIRVIVAVSLAAVVLTLILNLPRVVKRRLRVKKVRKWSSLLIAYVNNNLRGSVVMAIPPDYRYTYRLDKMHNSLINMETSNWQECTHLLKEDERREQADKFSSSYLRHFTRNDVIEAHNDAIAKGDSQLAEALSFWWN